MHLQPLGFDDLNCGKFGEKYQLKIAELDGSKKKDSPVDEINNENLLFKVIFSVISYFCIGTELRFLSVLDPLKFSPKDSEIWHAKAVHVASYFLPNGCPLLNHISQSYIKHHLRQKVKRR